VSDAESGFDEPGRRVPIVRFDYDAVDYQVFGAVPKKDVRGLTSKEVDAALALLRVMLAWIWQSGMKNPDGIKIRAVIICWVFLKELRGLTLTQIAAAFGMDKQSFGRWITDFKQTIPIRTPHMLYGQPLRAPKRRWPAHIEAMYRARRLAAFVQRNKEEWPKSAVEMIISEIESIKGLLPGGCRRHGSHPHKESL